MTVDKSNAIGSMLRRDHLAEIRRAGQGEIQVDSQNWSKYLAARPSAVRALVDEYPTSISRADLHELATKQNSTSARERLFVAAMMWGRGKKNARMLPGICSCLEHPDLSATLRRTSRLIAAGLPGDAYNAWTHAELPGLGEAFFTKWLYASGSAIHDNALLRPLVLDSNVWRSLNALGWSSERASGFRYRTNRAAGYCAYLRSAHDWAAELSMPGAAVSAEKIEVFLFARNGDLQAA